MGVVTREPLVDKCFSLFFLGQSHTRESMNMASIVSAVGEAKGGQGVYMYKEVKRSR